MVSGPGRSSSISAETPRKYRETSAISQTRRATTVLFNYRGYGESTGKPSERDLVEDAVAVSEWTKARFPGATPGAVRLEPRHRHRGAGCGARQTRCRDTRKPLPQHRSHRAETLSDISRALDAATSVSRRGRRRRSMPPTLVIASSKDGVIPYEESQAMVRAMRAVEDGSPVEFHTIDVRHGEFPGKLEFWRAVDDFLVRVSQT